MQRRKLMRLMAMLMQEAQGQKALMQEAHGHKALMQAQWQKALMQEQGQKALGQKALMEEAHGHTTIHGQEALIHGQEALINGALMQADVALMQANGQHGTVMQADGGHRQNRALMQADGALMQEPLMQADGTLVSTVIGNSLIECISWKQIRCPVPKLADDVSSTADASSRPADFSSTADLRFSCAHGVARRLGS